MAAALDSVSAALLQFCLCALLSLSRCVCVLVPVCVITQTYSKKVTIRPGPRLNLILGPNG